MQIQLDRRAPALRLLALLEGEWIGEGRGEYPTIAPFDYREWLMFERRDEVGLFYRQRTEKRPLGTADYVMSHWESGFVRVLPPGDIEWVNAQTGGRGEVLVGTVEPAADKLRLQLRSRLVSNDERMVASARTLEVEPDRLSYQMEMQTTRVDRLAIHLVARLVRAG